MKKEKMPVLFREDTRPNKDDFSRIEIVQKGVIGHVTSIVGDAKHWCAFDDEYHLFALGDRIFWKKDSSRNVTYKDGRLYGDISPFIRRVCEVFKLDWVLGHKYVQYLLKGKKDLWQMILSGRITNPEMLCKHFSKKYFKGAYSYRSLKTIWSYPGILGSYGISLWDVYYYTTNPEWTIMCFIRTTKDPLTPWKSNCSEETSWKQAFSDSLKYCRMLNQKIDPKWSLNRLREEHQKQIRIVNLKKIEDKNPEPITDDFTKEGLSLITNERDCFIEGLNMGNCVYSYWSDIKDGYYLLAKGTINGEYLNIGFKYRKDDIIIDQINNRYNGYLDSSKVPVATVKFVENWLKEYKQELLDIVKGIKARKRKYMVESKSDNTTDAIPW